MAVQLPDDLVIAAGRIEIRHLAPEQRRRDAVVDRIAMPVDRGRRRADDSGAVEGASAGASGGDGRESQIAIAEQVQAPVRDGVGAPDGIGRGVGKAGADRPRDRLAHRRLDRPAARPRREMAGEGGVRVIDASGRQVRDRAGQLRGPRHDRCRQVVAPPRRRACPVRQPRRLAPDRAGEAVADFGRRHGGDASEQAGGAHHGCSAAATVDIEGRTSRAYAAAHRSRTASHT